MRRILIALTVILSSSTFLVYEAMQRMPDAKGTSVIGEKPTHISGGQAVMLLPSSMELSQHAILNKAFEIAKADGHRDPQLVQGVLLQESRAGGHPNYRVAGTKDNLYYGVGQVKLVAARDVLAAYPVLWTKYNFQTKTDDELKAHLILNTIFNIEVTSKYLRLLQIRYGLTGRDLLNAYQLGPDGHKRVDADEHYYALGVESKLSKLKLK